MSRQEVDSYLSQLEEAKRRTLQELRYLPHSGSVFPELKDEVAAYPTSRGALQFPIDTPLPRALVEKLIAVRIGQIQHGAKRA